MALTAAHHLKARNHPGGDGAALGTAPSATLEYWSPRNNSASIKSNEFSNIVRSVVSFSTVSRFYLVGLLFIG